MGVDPVTEEAALWRTRLDAGTAEKAALEAWLDADPRRRPHFERVEAVWAFFDEVRDHPEIRGLSRGRVARARRLRRLGTTIAGGLAASAAGVALLLAALSQSASDSQLFQTNGDSREVVQLSDGSRVTLDVRSKLLVRYTPSHRDLILYRGQAMFDVAHDPGRPFAVSALGRTVVATGTAFDVDVNGPTLTVSLLRGHVKILKSHPRRAPVGGAAVRLEPDQSLVSDARGDVVAHFCASAALAWESGRIVFYNATLGEAVTRENRYASAPIGLADPALARLRLSGVFDAGDTKAFAEAVSAMLPVSAHLGDDGAISLAAKSSHAAAGA